MEDRNPARPKVDRMASKKTVTLHNVASLGPERLAAILVDLAEADAEVNDAYVWNWPRRSAETASPRKSANASPL
jgi:hypothetical protein